MDEEVQKNNDDDGLDKSYLIGLHPRVTNIYLYAQVCGLDKETFTIRVVASPLDEYHSKFQVIGMIWNVIKDYKEEDFKFKTLDEARLKLTEIAQTNKWSGFY